MRTSFLLLLVLNSSSGCSSAHDDILAMVRGAETEDKRLKVLKIVKTLSGREKRSLLSKIRNSKSKTERIFSAMMLSIIEDEKEFASTWRSLVKGGFDRASELACIEVLIRRNRKTAKAPTIPTNVIDMLLASKHDVTRAIGVFAIEEPKKLLELLYDRSRFVRCVLARRIGAVLKHENSERWALKGALNVLLCDECSIVVGNALIATKQSKYLPIDTIKGLLTRSHPVR